LVLALRLATDFCGMAAGMEAGGAKGAGVAGWVMLTVTGGKGCVAGGLLFQADAKASSKRCKHNAMAKNSQFGVRRPRI
jgi:hypothetical protein